MKAELEVFEIPRDKAGRIKWNSLAKDPEKVILAIETLASQILETGEDISSSTTLEVAISRYYPGGTHVLRDRLGLPQIRRPLGFWQSPDAPEIMRQEAQAFLEAEGSLTQTLLEQKGRSDLNNAFRLYPGGMRQLKADINIKTTKQPNGYWDPERIKQEALSIFQNSGTLTPNFLSKEHRDDLRTAITQQYPGGWRQLRIDLDLESLRVPNNFWTPEQIELVAGEFYQTHKQLTKTFLERNGYSNVAAQIQINYPGSWSELRRKFGLEVLQHKWTPEEIWQEVLKVQSSEGKVTRTVLGRLRKTGLAAAIYKKYPGGWKQLRADLVNLGEQPKVVSPDEANIQLAKLLKETI